MSDNWGTIGNDTPVRAQKPAQTVNQNDWGTMDESIKGELKTDSAGAYPNTASGIRSANDIPKVYSKEQLADDFYLGSLNVVAYRINLKGKDYPVPYAEYTVDNRNNIDPAYIYDGNKVRTPSSSDPLYQIIADICKEQGLEDPHVYDKTTVSDKFDRLYETNSNTSSNISSLLNTFNSDELDKDMTTEQKKKYDEAFGKYTILAEAIEKKLSAQKLEQYLNDCIESFKSLYEEVYAKEIHSGKISSFNDIMLSKSSDLTEEQSLNAALQVIEAVKGQMTINYYGRDALKAQIKQSKEIVDALSSNGGDRIVPGFEALFGMYDKLAPFGKGAKEEFMRNAKLFSEGKLVYKSATGENADGLFLAREADFSSGGNKLTSFIICSDQKQTGMLLEELCIGDKEARNIINTEGVISSDGISQRAANIKRDVLYSSVIDSIKAGSLIKTSGKRENDEIVQITKEYVVLKELGLDPTETAKIIEGIDARKNSITAKYDEKMMLDYKGIKIELDENDFKLIVKLLTYVGYLDGNTKGIATKENVGILLLNHVASKPALIGSCMRQDEKAKCVQITVGTLLINDLLNECGTRTTIFIADDKKVYVRGNAEKVLIPIEGYTIKSQNALQKSSDIRIELDGRNLRDENPTFVFKLYLFEKAGTARPINDGVYESVLTADEVKKFVKLTTGSTNGSLSETRDSALLKKLARYIETTKVVVKDIYEDVAIYSGKEEMCKDINEALSIIRDYYENTVSRNIEIVADGEQQELRERSEKGRISAFDKTWVFGKDAVGQIIKFPSSPKALTGDNVADETILAIKENMFDVNNVGKEYLSDPLVDAEFIRAFVKQYKGLLNNSIVSVILGMDGEKLSVKDPAAELLKVADLMQKNNERINIHFGRDKLRKEYQTAKVILQGALQLYTPGVKKVNASDKELNVLDAQITALFKGITAYPFALSLKGYLVLNKHIEAGSVSLNDNKINGEVVSAAAKDFRKFIDEVLSKQPKEVLDYIALTKLSVETKEDIECYCKVLEEYAGKPIKEFDLTYDSYGADKELINALKVYIRSVIQIQNSSKDNGTEGTMNIAISSKKLMDKGRNIVRAKSVKEVNDGDVLVTSQKVPFGENKDVIDAAKGGAGQIVLWKFIMERMIQLQMQAGSFSQGGKIAKAMANDDPYASGDIIEAGKTFVKTRISFLAFMLNPYVWAKLIIDQAKQGDPTAIATLLITGPFILGTTGALITLAARGINRYVYRAGGEVSMGQVSESSVKLSSVYVGSYSRELQETYAKARHELMVKEGIDGERLPVKLADIPGFKDAIEEAGSKALVEYQIKSGAKGTIRIFKSIPRAIIDPVGMFEVLTRGLIKKWENAIGKPLKYVKTKAIRSMTKRGQLDPKVRISEPSLQETIISAIKNPNHDFTFTFNHENIAVRKTAEPLRKAYEFVEGTRVGSWFMGKMGIQAPDPGTGAIVLKGWQIARVLSPQNRDETINVLGLKATRAEEALLLSNLSESAEFILLRRDAVEYLNKNLGWELNAGEYDLNGKSGLAKLGKDINERISKISENGERMYKQEIAEFKKLYEYAAKNPLSVLEFDVGLAEKYNLKLKITGQELCTLYKLFNAPFEMDTSMGFGPRSMKKYGELIESVMKRNPWLENFYMRDGITPSESKIFNDINEGINKSIEGGYVSSRAVMEERIKALRPLEYKAYKKVKEFYDHERLRADTGNMAGWSKEDKILFEKMSSVEKYYEVESNIQLARIVDISKGLKPIEENCAVQPGDPPVIETEYGYKIGDKIFDKKEINDSLSKDPKAYEAAREKYIKELDTPTRRSYEKGLKIKQSQQMADIGAMITDPLIRKFNEAYPRTVTGSISVANPGKIIVNIRYDQVKKYAALQQKMMEKYSVKNENKDASEAKATVLMLPEAVTVQASNRSKYAVKFEDAGIRIISLNGALAGASEAEVAELIAQLQKANVKAVDFEEGVHINGNMKKIISQISSGNSNKTDKMFKVIKNGSKELKVEIVNLYEPTAKSLGSAASSDFEANNEVRKAIEKSYGPIVARMVDVAAQGRLLTQEDLNIIRRDLGPDISRVNDQKLADDLKISLESAKKVTNTYRTNWTMGNMAKDGLTGFAVGPITSLMTHMYEGNTPWSSNPIGWDKFGIDVAKDSFDSALGWGTFGLKRSLFELAGVSQRMAVPWVIGFDSLGSLANAREGTEGFVGVSSGVGLTAFLATYGYMPGPQWLKLGSAIIASTGADLAVKSIYGRSEGVREKVDAVAPVFKFVGKSVRPLVPSYWINRVYEANGWNPNTRYSNFGKGIVDAGAYYYEAKWLSSVVKWAPEVKIASAGSKVVSAGNAVKTINNMSELGKLLKSGQTIEVILEDGKALNLPAKALKLLLAGKDIKGVNAETLAEVMKTLKLSDASAKELGILSNLLKSGKWAGRIRVAGSVFRVVGNVAIVLTQAASIISEFSKNWDDLKSNDHEKVAKAQTKIAIMASGGFLVDGVVDLLGLGIGLIDKDAGKAVGGIYEKGADWYANSIVSAPVRAQFEAVNWVNSHTWGEKGLGGLIIDEIYKDGIGHFVPVDKFASALKDGGVELKTGKYFGKTFQGMTVEEASGFARALKEKYGVSTIEFNKSVYLDGFVQGEIKKALDLSCKTYGPGEKEVKIDTQLKGDKYYVFITVFSKNGSDPRKITSFNLEGKLEDGRMVKGKLVEAH